MRFSDYGDEKIVNFFLESSYVGYCIGPSGVYFFFSAKDSDLYLIEILVCSYAYFRKNNQSKASRLFYNSSNINRELLSEIQSGIQVRHIEIICDQNKDDRWISIDFDDGSQIAFGESLTADEEQFKHSIFVTKIRKDEWRGRIVKSSVQ